MQNFIVIVCCTFKVIIADKLLLTALLDQDFTHARRRLFLIRCQESIAAATVAAICVVIFILALARIE